MSGDKKCDKPRHERVAVVYHIFVSFCFSLQGAVLLPEGSDGVIAKGSDDIFSEELDGIFSKGSDGLIAT